MSDNSIELQITIYRDDAVPSGGPRPRIFTRMLDMAHAPSVGDLMYIIRSDEEPEGSIGTYVKDRFWTWIGTLIIEMKPYHIDPIGLAVQLVDGRNRAYWDSRDGDLCANLISSGFEEL